MSRAHVVDRPDCGSRSGPGSHLRPGPHIDQNDLTCACLVEDVDALLQHHEVMTVGDFNGHIEELDGRTESNECRLIGLVERGGLVVDNGTPKYQGAITWASLGCHSSIDYALMTDHLFEALSYMIKDEDSTDNLGSDHSRIRLIYHGIPEEQGTGASETT